MQPIQSLTPLQLELLTLLVFQQAGLSQATMLRLLPPAWERSSVNEVLGELVEAGWVEQFGLGWRVPVSLQERAARYAWRNLALPLRLGPREELAAPLALRELRVALYAGDEEHFAFHWGHQQPDFWKPFDPEWLDWLKPAIWERLIEQRVLSGPVLHEKEAAYLESRSQRLAAKVRVELAFQALLGGRLEVGEELARGVDQPAGLACLAFAQMQRGQAELAAKSYAQARAELRRRTGKRKVQLEGPSAWLELLALMESSPGEIEKWLSDSAPKIPALYGLARMALGTPSAVEPWRGGEGLEGLLEALLLTWQGRPQPAWEREVAELEKGGQHWLAAEYASLLGRPQAHRALGTRSLLAALNLRPHWERALEALEKVRAAPETVYDLRLVWKVEVYRDGTSLTMEPVEQKRGARGWSEGRVVSLKRLAGDWSARPHLLEADRQICGLIRQVHSGLDEVLLNTRQAAPFLIGHPLVLHRETGRRLTVSRARPRLDVTVQGQDWLLKMVTPTDYQLQNGTLRILQCNECETALQSALGDGLLVPPEGQLRFCDLLRGLSGEFVGSLPEGYPDPLL